MRFNRLTVGLLIATALVSPALAQELPSVPVIVSGDVNISTRPGVMNLSHTTDSAIINWNSFSLGAGGEIRIDQPGAYAVLLNRVTGDAPSTIAGKIIAPGQVFIVNPNGIAITSTGVVNTAGFTASTLDISDTDFLAKNYVFEGDGSSAMVSNAGRIEVASGGYAALLGGRIDNSGSIIAPLGKIGLGAAELITLDLTGDGFLQVAVPSEVDGTDPLISNSGLISANGGYVQLSVAAAKDAARNVINLSGTVEARSFSGRSGAIVLSGDGGAVTISGKVDTSTAMATAPEPKVTIIPIPAARPNFRGGDITITGNAIRLADAEITATGYEGGGNIRIGGDFHGNGLIPTSTTLDVDFLTSITADALLHGNGGTIVLWSDEATRFAGRISARGAGIEGAGGKAEVSGAHLAFTGTADLGAPSGKGGTLLLDPINFVIDDADPLMAGFSWLDVATLIAILSGGTNVEVSTDVAGADAGDLIVNDSFGWTTGATLTLRSNRDMTISGGSFLGGALANIILFVGRDLFAGMEIRGVNLTANVTGDANLNFLNLSGLTTVDATNVWFNTEASSDGGFIVNAANDITTSLLMNFNGFTAANGSIVFTAGNDIWLGSSIMTASGAMSFDAGRDINVRSDVVAGGALSAIAGRNIDFSVDTPGSVTQSGSLTGATVFVEAGGRLLLPLETDISSTAGDIVINVGQFINENNDAAFNAAGRWIVYSADWDMDTRGLPGLNLYNRTYTSSPPGSTLPGSNVFVYSRQPTLTFTINDALRMYFGMIDLVPPVSFTGLVNDDLIGYATLGDYTDIRDFSAADADVGSYMGVLRPLTLSSPVGYAVSYIGGNLSVTPAPLTIVANSFSKIYGDLYAFTGTEFTTDGLLGSDTVGGLTLTSIGASGTATVAGSPYAIVASNATGSDMGNYTISYVDGAMTVTPRALTVTALDLAKIFMTEGAFTGTEFTTAGLVNADRVDMASLTSTGLPAGAPIGLYPILIGGATGSGLDNYTITYVPGTMGVTLPPNNGTIPPNYPPPTDTPTIIGLIDPTGDELPGVLGPEISSSDAAVTLQSVERISQQFAAQIAECERQLEASSDEGAYLTCAGDALETYADALENPLIKLPPELKAAVTVIRQTAQRVRAAAANPNRQAAVAEARAAVGEMVDFVRQQTALVRAVDPDTQALLQQTGQVMTQALNDLEVELVSAVEI